MANIHKIIAAVSPDVYCDPKVRDEVKKTIKEKGYSAAIKIAEEAPRENVIDVDAAKAKPLDARGLKAPSEVHKLVYDSTDKTLEPMYFWILDFLSKAFKKVDKITDTFSSSVGSGFFSELGQKATKMQDEAMKQLGAVNQVLKSVLNIIYDLKEFKLRLELYDRYRNSQGAEREAALFSLKQVWLDNVDIKRGTTSIKGLAQQFDYVSIIDAFMASRSPEHASTLDLNDRVKRIVMQRIGEFQHWITESEGELRKRYEIERNYLKSQMNTVRLYTRWVKPYLKAARQLEQGGSADASLVSTFNTMILELTLFASSPYKAEDDVNVGDLPQLFKNLKGRQYSGVVVVEFKFRGIPQRVANGYSYGGKAEVKLTSYGLNDQEIEIIKKELEREDIGDAMQLIQGATDDSLAIIQKDIEEFIDPPKKEEKKEENKSDDVNPFAALFSFVNFFKPSKEEKKKEDFSKGIRPDDRYERVLRSQAIIDASDKCKNVFEIYKKAHQMPAP